MADPFVARPDHFAYRAKLAMDPALIWAIVCMAAGLGLLVIEVFIPSGGLIGFLALGLLGVSLWQAFTISSTVGLTFLAALVVMVPLTAALALHLFPKTPMGRWLLLKPPSLDEVAPEPSGPRLEHLIGQFGRALTPLRPSGLVDFDGRRLDGLSEEGLIPRGALVRAVQIRGGQLIVRTASDPTFEDFPPS
jgi:membrane-bound ClpP family serine protease